MAVLKRKTIQHMIIALLVSYGAIAALIGLTLEDYSKTTMSYLKK